MKNHNHSTIGEQAFRPVEKEKLLTYGEAALMIGLGIGTLRSCAKEGRIRLAKFNKRVHRLFESDVRRLRQEALA